MLQRGDFLVIGSGIAGLRAAVTLASAGGVVILSKADPADSNTAWAQGGIAAAVGADDSVALHVDDTLKAGDGLCVRAAVEVLAADGARAVRELLAWGAAFDREPDGTPALGREAAHTVRRVLHARDATGREIAETMWRRAAALARVRIVRAMVTSLIVEDGRCAGARYTGADGSAHEARAAATLLATGGAGQVFRETTNPEVATGDGMAMAFEAGARVADLEFVQFHPTALKVDGVPRFLLTEALRGEGARLVNARGEAFMSRHEPQGDLAPRDRVSRAIVREAERTGGPVFLSLAHLDARFVHERFPTVARTCAEAGLDLARDPIPVGPAAHYVMGGVETDLWGRTTVPGLFAAGEVACTGVHGANRLASNSLLEGLVFGTRAAEAMQQPPGAGGLAGSVSAASRDAAPWPAARPADGTPMTAEDVRDLMWRSVGLARDRAGLSGAVARLGAGWQAAEARRRAAPGDREAARAWSLTTVGLLMARAALRREESRGGHFRSDFPGRDDEHWRIHVSDAITP